MNDSGPPRLAQFEELKELTPDPQIRAANLAAQQSQEPQLARDVDQAGVPAHWRCVRGLDGFTTFRIEEPGQPPRWLAGTAAPATRAAGLLETVRIGEQNPTLSALAAGAELRFLLEHLPAYRAIYVFERDLHVLAAVLSTVDFASDIQAGRCVFVPPGREFDFLEHQLSKNPGLLPPGLIICLPEVPQERLEQVRAICEQTAQRSHALRTQRLAELAVAGTSATAPGPHPRLAILALRPDNLAAATAAALDRAGRQLGWPVLTCSVQTPRDVHPLKHVAELAAFAPSAIICLGHGYGLPYRTSAQICAWHLSSAGVPAQLPADEILHLGVSPRVSNALRLAATPIARVADWYWGCAPAEAAAHTRDAAILVGNLADDDPAAVGVEQPSHKLIWQRAREAIRQLWVEGKFITAATVLRYAERAARLELPATDIRTAVLRAIEYTLIPTTLLRTISQALSSGPGELVTIGQGWPRRAEGKVCESISEFMAQPQPWRPLAAVLADPADPLSPSLLQAGALRWPLLLYGSGGPATAAALGHVLRPGDYRTFIDQRGLITSLQAFRRDPVITREQAERTGSYLCTEHSYARRLVQLEKLLQSRRTNNRDSQVAKPGSG